ncbi:MAG: putative Ig domain-containing protein [Candidatus Microbacterium phytovorans]|uniref:Ig domain-containing protein n=1 Tax=Candidatus Microbacterium phytovorans TaxID=3121374 RepID=A0AAJ5VZP2_9MICO|nr:putative Ig domain-containing protein [Microbacterium sp.]WEK13209.1 MAG: putative Ig domain-containing protein [Microbacterium sp.]
MPTAAVLLRVSAALAALALAAALTPSPPAAAAPDYDDVDGVYFTTLDDRPTRLALSSDGSRLYGGSNQIDGPGVLTVMDAASGALIAQKTFSSGVGDVEVSPDGRRVYFTHGGSEFLGDCYVTEVDAKTLKVVRDLHLGQRCRYLTISRTGKTLFVSDHEDVLFVDVATGTVRNTVYVPGYPEDLALTADGSKLYVADPQASMVNLISVTSKTHWGGTLLPTVSSDPDWLDTLHVSPDGEMLYAVSDRAIYTVPLAGPVDVERFPAANHHSTALSRDGKRLYLSGTNLKVFDTESHTFSVQPTDWGGSASALIESVDGRRLHLSALGYIITLGATRSLVYPDSSMNVVAGKSFRSTTPTYRYGSDDAHYRVSPALPSGLRLNSSTGVISGTPPRAQATQRYTVYTDYLLSNTDERKRVKASVTIRVVTQAPTAKIALTKTSQKYATTKPAKLAAVVSPEIPGTFRVYDGSTKIASVSTKTGRILWTLPRTLKVGTHTVKVVFVPANRDMYRLATSSTRTLTVTR